MWSIYKIISPSGKIYIGSAKDYTKRMNRYKCLDCKKQPKLYRSFLKYGFAAHSTEVIHRCPEVEAYKMERKFGELYGCLGDNGLNISLPGYGDIPKVMTDEYRASVSRRVSGSNNPMYGKAGFAGKRHSEESKEKCRSSKTGELNAMYGVSGIESPNHSICLHKEYGLFVTLSEAAKMSGYSFSYMSQMLNNVRHNKTNFIKP